MAEILSEKLVIDSMTEKDWSEVAAIYQEGIDTGNATFAITPPSSWNDWCKSKINTCSIVAREDNVILGWAAISPVSERCVYRGVAEVSIYISKKFSGKGIGSRLLQKLIEVSEYNTIWTLQAGIFPENKTSVNLHLKYGFRIVGVREKLGKMDFGEFKNKWRDVLLLERRSRNVGV
jgi:L-amino acid N-acyltransferase YncA